MRAASGIKSKKWFEPIQHLRLVNGPKGRVAIYNTNSKMYFVPKTHYESINRTKRNMSKRPHMTNEATTSMVDLLKQKNLADRKANNITILKAEHLRDMYQEDEWLQSLCDETVYQHKKTEHEKRTATTYQHKKTEPKKRTTPTPSPPRKQVYEEEKEIGLSEKDLKRIRLIIREELSRDFLAQAKKEILKELIGDQIL